MVRKQANLIVWNELGEECQRLYFHYLNENLGRNLTKFEYSDYHTSKYSFEDDSMFFLTHVLFFLIPNNKSQSYAGYLAQAGLGYAWVSAHPMKNSTVIWLLGGFKYQLNSQCKFCVTHTSDRLAINEYYETRIVDLKFVFLFRNCLDNFSNRCKVGRKQYLQGQLYQNQ